MKRIIITLVILTFMNITTNSFAEIGDEQYWAMWGTTWNESYIKDMVSDFCNGYDYLYMISDRYEATSYCIGCYSWSGNELFIQIDETYSEVWIWSCASSHPDGENADIDGDGIPDISDYDPNDPEVHTALTEEMYAVLMSLAGLLSGFMLWFGIIVNT